MGRQPCHRSSTLQGWADGPQVPTHKTFPLQCQCHGAGTPPCRDPMSVLKASQMYHAHGATSHDPTLLYHQPPTSSSLPTWCAIGMDSVLKAPLLPPPGLSQASTTISSQRPKSPSSPPPNMSWTWLVLSIPYFGSGSHHSFPCWVTAIPWHCSNSSCSPFYNQASTPKDLSKMQLLSVVPYHCQD